MACKRIRVPPSLKPGDEVDQWLLDAGIVPTSMDSILTTADGKLREEYYCTKCDESCNFDNTVPAGPEDSEAKLRRDLRVWKINKDAEQDREDAAVTAAEPHARGRKHKKKSKKSMKSGQKHRRPTSRERRPRGRSWTAADCDTDCSCSDSDDLQELGERESVSLERAHRNRERGKRGGRAGGGWPRGGYGGGRYGNNRNSDWGYAYSYDYGYRGSDGTFDFFSGSPFRLGFGPRF